MYRITAPFIALVALFAFLWLQSPNFSGDQAAAAPESCTPGSDWPSTRTDYATRVIELVNQHRAGIGVGALKVSPTLTDSAVWKSRHMAQYRYMQHDDPAPPVARSFGARVAACSYSGGGAGENIAYGYRTPEAVMQGWLNSPGHRSNIENGGYVVIGVAAATTADGTPYWTQNFGTGDDSGAASQPQPAPQPQPQPQPRPQPEPQPQPQPVPQPQPQPAPQTEPQPAPQFDGHSQQTTPEPSQPAPQPEPAPRQEPQPAPFDDHAGQPTLPQPAPRPEQPAAGPQPQPVPVVTVAAPGSALVQPGSHLGGTVAALGADDGHALVVAAKPSTHQAAWSGRFRTVPNALRNLRVAYTGTNSTACTQRLLIWSFRSGAWMTLDSRPATSESEIEVAVPGTPADYVSGRTGSGDVLVGIRCIRGDSTSFSSHGDLLQLEFARA